MSGFSRSSLLCLGLASVASAWSQTAPDAGALRQQIDNSLKTPLPPESAPLQAARPAPLALPEGAQLTVKRFRFEGNTLLDEPTLRAVVQRWLDRPIGFRDLQDASQAVATAYRDAGWIVQAWLPRQDVTEGTVTIAIVEAKFAGAHLEGAQPLRMSPELVVDVVQADQPVGAPLNAEALDRGLLLADDLPGVNVSGALESGDKDGETALALRMTDEPLANGEVSADNGGSRSTGAGRVLATAYLNSPLGVGDQMRGDAIDSKGNHYGRVAYTVPLGVDGLRAGLNASVLGYRLVGADFAALQASGTSDAWGADFSYPLVRSRKRNLYLSLNGERTVFLNRANGLVQSSYGIDSATVGLAGNAFDELGGSGANTFSLAWEHGDLRQGHLDIGENPALAGGYDKLRYGGSRQQAITESVSLYGALSGQYADKTLDSSGRFYLGGPAGVRAYPVNEGSGDRGQIANLELRWRPADAFTLTGFGDWGHVASSLGQGNESLKGVGLSAIWLGPYNLNTQATVARRIGSNPDRDATTGKDQDGSLDRDRFWLQAQLPF